MKISILRKVIGKFQKIRNFGRENSISVACRMSGVRITVLGNNNTITIDSTCIFRNAEIIIEGNNNLVLEPHVRILGPCRIVMTHDGRMILRENCGIRGGQFTVGGATIDVGERAMFSCGIIVRNHDSHHIFAQGADVPCNPPADVIIGAHTWICQNVSILKGVNIGHDSVVAFGAVVTKGCPPGSILAGNPAKIVKNNINWNY